MSFRTKYFWRSENYCICLRFLNTFEERYSIKELQNIGRSLVNRTFTVFKDHRALLFLKKIEQISRIIVASKDESTVYFPVTSPSTTLVVPKWVLWVKFCVNCNTKLLIDQFSKNNLLPLNCTQLNAARNAFIWFPKIILFSWSKKRCLNRPQIIKIPAAK